MRRRSVLMLSAPILASLVLPSGSVSATPLRDGRLFDPGAAMTRRAGGAAPELDAVTFFRGSWDVSRETVAADTVLHSSSGAARITFMNRGHALMMRMHCADADTSGRELDTMGFLMYEKNSGAWLLGEANSIAENITLYDGAMDGDRLVLSTALRRR